ncbi:MAG: TetR/AcrR family transcriptional regulator [Cryobacterium sp.]
MQQRSASRLSELLDAAAEVVDLVGFDRITTAMIAERAGASIGTVYRYYPDRVAVLQALRERTLIRFRARIAEEITVSRPKTWWDAVDCAVTAFVNMYRAEPGFRILHFADSDRGSSTPSGVVGAAAPSSLYATRLAAALVDEFGLTHDPDLGFRLEVAVEMADALLSRAFLTDSLGEDRFIVECRRVVYDYLSAFFDTDLAQPVEYTS